MFIDKYMQVPRILAPVVRTLEQIEQIGCKNAKLKEYVTCEYGSTKNCTRVILRDFVRHGFDGSGDDGGSCIDGRLTSAWNWCSKISKKNFYPVFLLTGFVGFDGGEAAKISDIALHIKADNYGVVEDAHHALMHIFSQYLRLESFEKIEDIQNTKF